jgi:hypothetical protein
MSIRRHARRGPPKIMIAAVLTAGFLAVASLPAAAAVAPTAASTSLGRSSVSALNSAPNKALLARSGSSSPRPIGPFTITTRQGKLTYGWRPGSAGRTVPNYAAQRHTTDKCNFNACLNIVGSGLYVTDWDTSAFYGGSGTLCTRAAWHQNGAIIRTGPTICGKGPGTFYSAWTPHKNFPNNTLACNGWTNVKGYPCATIHS